MNITKKISLLILLATAFANLLSAQKAVTEGFYKKEMQSLQASIEKNFYDKASGYHIIDLDSSKRDKKGDYIREYTYLWAYCALYQAANEIERISPNANLMEPMLKIMNDYYNQAPPKPGYTDYIMKLKPGERYYDDNQWIGITALDAYERTKKRAYFDQGKAMFDFMITGYNNVLDGGIYWKEGDLSSKNTCSNGPGALVALQMYKATKQKGYLDTAILICNWTDEKLRTPAGLYYDNIRTKDKSIGKAIFSYNTGTMLETNVYLYECTGDKKYLTTANAIADSSLTFFYGRNKFRDGYWFNAVLLRAYQHLLIHNNDMKYIRGFKKCLDYALQNEKNKQGLFKGRDGVHNLVDMGGMLEILARYAWLESHYDLAGSVSLIPVK